MVKVAFGCVHYSCQTVRYFSTDPSVDIRNVHFNRIKR